MKTQQKGAPASESKTKIALIGCGTVGAALYHYINVEGILPSHTITRVVVKAPAKPRSFDDDGRKITVEIPPELLATNHEAILADPKISIVVDATNEDISEFLMAVMADGKHVITTNKAMVAKKGAALQTKAAKWGVAFRAEGCVGGKNPWLQTARSISVLRVRRVEGVVNGTCAYMLNELQKHPDATFADLLAKARELGFAEADPSADIDGHDAVAKTLILANTFFHAETLKPEAGDFVFREGIRDLPPYVMKFARAHGRKVVLCATVERDENAISMIVMPTLVLETSFLGQLQGVDNGLVISDGVGSPLRLEGPGAGGAATTAAIIQDIVGIKEGDAAQPALTAAEPPSLIRPEKIMIRAAFLSRSSQHRHKVLLDKIRVISNTGLSIETLHNESADGDTWDVIVVEAATIEAILEAKRALESLACIVGTVHLLRVLGNKRLTLK